MNLFYGTVCHTLAHHSIHPLGLGIASVLVAWFVTRHPSQKQRHS